MRLRALLPAALAACCVVGALAGCAASDPASHGAPTGSLTAVARSAAVDLAGTTWRVEGAAGAADGTTASFSGTAITVAAGGRSSHYAWSAQGDQVLVGGRTSSLAGAVDASWLLATVQVRRTADGWTLLGTDGATTARLSAATAPSPAPAGVTALLRTARPGAGVVDAPASALEGRWAVAGTTTTAITFGAGTWRAASSCATGTVGGVGVYRVLSGGRLLVTRTAVPIRGCPITEGAITATPNAVSAISRAASFRVSGDTLVLFERSGTRLGALVRA
jgi:hypothetical protein